MKYGVCTAFSLSGISSRQSGANYLANRGLAPRTTPSKPIGHPRCPQPHRTKTAWDQRSQSSMKPTNHRAFFIPPPAAPAPDSLVQVPYSYKPQGRSAGPKQADARGSGARHILQFVLFDKVSLCVLSESLQRPVWLTLSSLMLAQTTHRWRRSCVSVKTRR